MRRNSTSAGDASLNNCDRRPLLRQMKDICLLNDSFPPEIDGVANTVWNYARVLNTAGKHACVITPEVRGADDSGLPYPVIRYPSLDMRNTSLGYTAGLPFTVRMLPALQSMDIGLMHSHCPAVSNLVARKLRETLDVPLVMTYHTKFDRDIARILPVRPLQSGVVLAMLDNINACDEVWAVSRGAGENLKALGYQGDYIVMENGVDMPRGRLPQETVERYTSGYGLPDGVPVMLFVGRMLWYKGIRIILDACSALQAQGIDYRMVFAGGGHDLEEMKEYAEELHIASSCIFLGSLSDREQIRAWYCRADLFLFPSTYDTNGLVVREAAACSLASVLIRGSAAAEGTKDGVNCLLIDENAGSLTACLAGVLRDRERMEALGEAAARDLYLSWEDAVHKAEERYGIVMDNYRAGRYPKHNSLTDKLVRWTVDFTESVSDVVDYYAEGDYTDLIDGGWTEN